VRELFATESDRAVTDAENHNWLGWFCSPESYALSSVGDSAIFLLDPGVDVLFPDNFEVGEYGFCDDLFELCFQQGTGNSASPQIDIVFRCEWNCFRCRGFCNRISCSGRLNDLSLLSKLPPRCVHWVESFLFYPRTSCHGLDMIFSKPSGSR
jgi:hypothetical protein